LLIAGVSAILCALFALMEAARYRKWKQEKRKKMARMLSLSSIASWSDRWVQALERTWLAEKLKPELKRASVRLRPGEYLILTGAVSLFLFYLLLQWFSFPWWTGLLIVIVIIPKASRFYLRMKRDAYVRKIEEQLPSFCWWMSNAASGGLSMIQIFSLVERELHPPLREEIRRLNQQWKLGQEFEQVLVDWANQIPSKQLRFLVHVLLMQKQVGGNLPLSLRELAIRLDERKSQEKAIRAILAQTRSTAYLLPILSFLFAYVFASMMGGIGFLFSSWWGIVLLLLFLFMQGFAFFLIKKITQIPL
jgi:tight adherence protein B